MEVIASMRLHRFTPLPAFLLLTASVPVWAQSAAGMPQGTNRGGAPAGSVSVSSASAEPLRFGRSMEHSVGLRTWAFIVPSWMVGLFANVNDAWPGAVNLAIGPEYTYRRGNLDVVVGIQYTGLQAPDGYFRGTNEGDVATERVKSSLWALYANALFLWNYRPNDWFEFQYGAGVGLGYVGGDLYRVQVYRNPPPAGPYTDCQGRGIPDPAYCDHANQHYGNYTEPRAIVGNGSIPPIVPWFSLPHLALHFRPHRHIDLRLDGGFALIGFYGGGALHYVF